MYVTSRTCESWPWKGKFQDISETFMWYIIGKITNQSFVFSCFLAFSLKFGSFRIFLPQLLCRLEHNLFSYECLRKRETFHRSSIAMVFYLNQKLRLFPLTCGRGDIFSHKTHNVNAYGKYIITYSSLTFNSFFHQYRAL